MPPNRAQILDNIAWLSFDHALRLGLGLFIGIWTARYLGPSEFGVLSYATAFVTVVGSFASLGLQGVVVRNLISRPQRASDTLGSALLLQFAAGAIASILALVGVQMANAGDETTIGLVSILALGLPLQSSSIVRYWFESKVLSRYVVWVDNAVFICAFFAKVLLISNQASLPAFAWVLLFQSFFTAAGLGIVCVHKFRGFDRWRPQWAECCRLLGECWPLALSGIAIIVYTRTDQIMLEQMSGTSSVGIYAASLKLSEACYAIPTIITASLFPSILALRSRDYGLYHRRIFGLLRISVVVAMTIAATSSLAAPFIVQLLFGNEYEASAGILRIQMWSSIFVFLGVASGGWLIAEGLQIHSFYRTAFGACINVAANLVLIPEYGAHGAALGTLASQVFAAYLMDLLSPKTRVMFMMKTKALMFWRRSPRT